MAAAFSDDIPEPDFEEDRTSLDRRRWDAETLGAEEEAERLLTGARGGQENRTGWFAQGKERGRRDRRENVEMESGEQSQIGEKEVMYRFSADLSRDEQEKVEMAEADEGSESDLRLLGQMDARRKKTRRSRICCFTAVHIAIALVFLLLLFGAWKISRGTAPPPPLVAMRSNGTHFFAPTTLLISLDGFRADFLARNLTPTLEAFIRSGVSPEYMTPVFPSVTFPNHFTMATGLYPESHGIVGNTFWDPRTQKEFYYTDPSRSLQDEWWNAEPIWLTAERADVRAAVHMWPGSEAQMSEFETAYIDKFNQHEPLDRKVDRIMEWLDLPGPADEHATMKHPRPQLIAAYVPNVDSDGHTYGPNSTEIRKTIAEADVMLAGILNGIEERNLTNIVNIVVVSDHGMATTSNERLIQLEDLIDTSLIEHIDGWPLYGLRPYDPSDVHLHELYDMLVAQSKLPQYEGTFTVYLRDETMPERYHFSKNPRIAPLWIVPHTGWAIVTREEFDIAANPDAVYHPRGLHGYDDQHPLMRAIFVARGPAFPHPPGARVPPFPNTALYNMICDTLGLQPAPNNGTLRLPLVTDGMHDFTRPWIHDVPDNTGDRLPASESPSHPSSPHSQPTSTTPASSPSPTPPKNPKPDQSEDDDGKIDPAADWWAWFRHRWDAVKDWAEKTWDQTSKAVGEKFEELKGTKGAGEKDGS